MNRNAIVTLAALALFLLHAQSAAQVYYSFSSSSGTYTAITGGSVLFSTTFDIATPSLVALPTAFTFAGTSYTSCKVSVEGWISFGGTNPGDAEVTPISSSSTAAGFIAPFGTDLRNSGTGTPEVQYKQVGNEHIFQWQDVRRSFTAATERFSFQTRLNTATNEIHFVYGFSASIDNTNPNFPQVGLRGLTNADFLNRVVPSGWAASTAGGANNATCTFSSTVFPASGLTYIWTPGPNVGVIAVSGISSGMLLPVGSTRPIHALVKNFAPPTQTLIPIYYTVNGGTRVGPVNTGSLAEGDTTTVSLTPWTPSGPGIDTIRVFTDLGSEQVRANDTTKVTNVIVQTPIAASAFPYYEKFTNATNWTTSGSAQWDRVSGTGPDSSGDMLARARFFELPSDTMYYRSPLLNLPSAPSGGAVLMHFHVAHRNDSSLPGDDTLQVVVSADGGATWSTPLYNKRTGGVPSLSTLPASTVYTPSATSDWRHETVNLTFYANQSNICVAFLGRSGNGNNCFIDNVSIDSTTDYSAPGVAGTGAFAMNNNSITINFTGGTQFPGTLHSARFSGRPPTIATVPFATNTTATNSDGETVTPNVVSDDRWWTVTYSADAVARNTYSVSISGAPSIPGVANAGKLYIVKRADKSASWVALTTTLAGGVLTASGLSSGFSDFGIAGDSTFNPLPIQLSSFAATVLNATSVRLNWTTASELNNYGFYVERRTGTQAEFAELPGGFIAGHGTTNEPHAYTFTDNTVPAPGSYQYRLRQVDLDGTGNHTEPINVTTGVTSVNGNEPAPKEFALFQNYPNPFNPSTTIRYDVPFNAEVTLEVYDVLGRSIAQLVNGRVSAGYQTFTFDAANLSGGVYFYKMTAAGENGSKFSSIQKMLLLK